MMSGTQPVARLLTVRTPQPSPEGARQNFDFPKMSTSLTPSVMENLGLPSANNL